MGLFRKTSEPPSPVPTEELALHNPSRSNTSTGESMAPSSRPPTRQSTKEKDFARPAPLITRMPSMQTRYMDMLLHLDQIPRAHNILAAIFTWVLLAGFLVIPGTFTSIKNSTIFTDPNSGDNVADKLLHAVVNIGLLWVSGACCAIGAVGSCVLWLRWRKNYVWLLNRIFFPAFLNSIAGLLTTIINVETAQKGHFSITAKITAIVTGSCTAVTLGLFLVYNYWVLEKVKENHNREMGSPRHHETPIEMMKRKVHEPGLEPGSIV